METPAKPRRWFPVATVAALGLVAIGAVWTGLSGARGDEAKAAARDSVQRQLHDQGFGFVAVAIEDGVLVLRGAAPDAETREAVAAAALAATRGLATPVARVDNKVSAPPPRAQPEPAPEGPPPPQPEECEEAFVRTIEGRSITFASGGATISPDSAPLLDELAAVAGRCAVYRITVEGHTDAIGSPDQNKALSERRARAVVAALAARGVNPDKLVAVGCGEEALLDPGAGPQADARNRRIAFKVTAG